jgi:hypothetical protein
MRSGKVLLAMASAIAFAGGMVVWSLSAHPHGDIAMTNGKRLATAPMACGTNTSALGYAATLKPGRSADELAARGYRVAGVFAAPGRADTVLVRATRADGNGLDLGAARRDDAIAAIDAVPAQSARSELQSCSYTLDDKPAARRLADATVAAASAAGIAASARLTGPGSLAMVADDPLDASLAIVTIDYPGVLVAGVPGSLHNPPQVSQLSLVALVEIGSARVLALHAGGWD